MSSSESRSDSAQESEGDLLRRRIAELEQRVADQQGTIDALHQTGTWNVAGAGTAHGAGQWQALLSLVDCSSDFIGLADMEGHALYVNEAGRNMVGIESLEAARKTLVSQYFDPADLPYVMETILPEVMRSGRWEGEYQFRHMLTGAKIPVHYSLFLAKNEKSEAMGLATITRDLRSIKRVEAERQRLQDEVIRMQASELAELSTPLIPISDRVVVMPLIGKLDEARARQVLATLLEGVTQRKSTIAILDVTGVSVVNAAVANALGQAAQAVGLLGAKVVLTGIRPEVARTLIDLGMGFDRLTVRGTLQSGIAFAMGRG